MFLQYTCQHVPRLDASSTPRCVLQYQLQNTEKKTLRLRTISAMTLFIRIHSLFEGNIGRSLCRTVCRHAQIQEPRPAGAEDKPRQELLHKFMEPVGCSQTPGFKQLLLLSCVLLKAQHQPQFPCSVRVFKVRTSTESDHAIGFQQQTEKHNIKKCCHEERC